MVIKIQDEPFQLRSYNQQSEMYLLFGPMQKKFANLWFKFVPGYSPPTPNS